MNKLILFFLILSSVDCISQKITLDYYPPYNQNTSLEEYDRGKRTLDFAYEQIKDIPESKAGIISHFLIIDGYMLMGVSTDSIYSLMQAAQSIDGDDFCKFMDFKIGGDPEKYQELDYYKVLGNNFLQLIESCSELEMAPIRLENLLSQKADQNLNGYNEELVDEIISLMDKDRFRTGTSQYFYQNLDSVRVLDKEVESELIKLFDTHGYIGSDQVGEHYQDYMCLLLEHCAKLPTIEKYLHVVAEAYGRGQLRKGALRMLIDRYYYYKKGVQIFGSHSGTPLANQFLIKKIKSEYNL